jgi:hypothetical protein
MAAFCAPKFTCSVETRAQREMMCEAGGALMVEAVVTTIGKGKATGFINLKWFSEWEPILPETTGRAGPSRQLSLRCADVHPVTCDAEWTAPSASQLVAKALDHGVHAHGFDPGWYTRERITAISRSARGAQADLPPDLPPDSPSDIDKTTGQQTRDLQVDEAAAMLCVSPDTLRAWEQRFGYPHSVPGGAGERRYAQREVIALRESLKAGLSIAAAIDKARRVGTDS